MNIVFSYDGNRPLFEFIVDPAEDCAMDCGAFASTFASYFYVPQPPHNETQQSSIQSYPAIEN